jgi:hypothetical protein
MKSKLLAHTHIIFSLAMELSRQPLLEQLRSARLVAVEVAVVREAAVAAQVS